MKLNIETSDSQRTLHILKELSTDSNVFLVYDNGRLADYTIEHKDGQEHVYGLEALHELTYWFYRDWQIRIY